jgi:hypothetical protein
MMRRLLRITFAALVLLVAADPTTAAASEATLLPADADGSVIDLGSDGTPDFVHDGLGSVIVGFNAHFGPGEYRGVYEFDVRGFRTCAEGFSARLRLSYAGTFAEAGDPNLTLLAATGGDGAVTIDDFASGTVVTGFSPWDSETYPLTVIDVSAVVQSAVDAGSSHVAFIVRPNPASSSVQGAFLFSSNEISDAYGFARTVLEADCTITNMPPVLTLPSVVPVDATSPTGASVDYSSLVSATDEDGPVAVSCTPSSGDVFPIGDATVACTAIGAAGNESTGSFTVHVKGAAEQVADLLALIDSYERGNLGSSLRDKLRTVQRFLAAGKPRQAEENLAAFVSHVEAQHGKGLTSGQADALVTAAERIIDVIEA